MWLEISVVVCIVYLPSYLSRAERSAAGQVMKDFQYWPGWKMLAKFLFGEVKIVAEAPISLKQLGLPE